MKHCRASTTRTGGRVTGIVVTSLIAISALLVLLAVLGVYDPTAPWRFKRSLMQELSGVTDWKQAERAAGPLGVVLGNPDGLWVVIGYRDRHDFGHPSVAIAKTSGGEWYVSREHWCGQFRIYSHERDQWARGLHSAGADFQTMDEWVKADGAAFRVMLLAIDRASDAENQRAALLRAGFRPIEP